MADTNAQADIRGLDIDKLAKGFADEEFVLKSFCTVSTTKAREIRWYKKTAGILDSVDTTGITASQIANAATKAIPVSVEQSWTRQTSYVRKYFVESPMIMEEDIKDTDIDILGTNIRDLVRAVANQVDTRIYNVLTENLTPVNINTAAATGTGWDDATNGNPVLDILVAQQNIRSNNYDSNGGILYINPIEHKNLMNWLMKVQGTNWTEFSSGQIKKHAVTNLLGANIVVNTNATTDYALYFVPKRACTWKSFMGLKTATMMEPGIGRKIRVWEEGEALLTDPKAVHLITDTVT